MSYNCSLHLKVELKFGCSSTFLFLIKLSCLYAVLPNIIEITIETPEDSQVTLKVWTSINYKANVLYLSVCLLLYVNDMLY